MATGAIPHATAISQGTHPRQRRDSAGPQNLFIPFAADAIEGSIAARFEAQVARCPEALAITDHAVRWTYGELNGHANRIGAGLPGDPKDVPIALLFDHGAPAVGAILGVLKAGRCYVPLNTQQPAARLARILADSGAKTILTDDRNATLAAEISNHAPRIISIDDLRAQPRRENLAVKIAPTDLAMVLFTSGSTGVPKGVVHDQRNILHNVSNVTNCLRLAESDRLAQLFSYDTGASIPQIYASLLNGASIHLFDIRARGFTDLAHWMAEEKITIYHSVPQVFRHLVAALNEADAFPELRLIRLGGEGPSIADVDLYRQHFSRAAILQISLASTEIAPIRGFFIDADTQLDGSIVPAGYQMPDLEVLILDDDGEEVAPGAAGLIAIKSDFLFCRYWGNPALTAAVMTTAPDGTRVFRTGDRGMILADGCLVHLGRRESMVKIGGISVEVAEVEAALLSGGGVNEVAVAGRPDRSGEMRLVAYVVGGASTRELRERLARALPGWMMPAAFVRMESLPVNRNGKIDRAALPDPTPVRYGEDPPRDPLEVSLVAIWEELLQLRPIGIRDDFFQLGGDSLLVLELITRIESMYDRHLPVSLLVEGPTVEQQACVLRESNWPQQSPAVVPLQLHGERPAIFFVPSAGHDVTSLIAIARAVGIEQPFYGLQPPGQDAGWRAPRSVEELATHFVAEVRKTRPHGPYFLGGSSYGGVVAFEMARQLTSAGEQVAFLGLLDSYAPKYPRFRRDAPLQFRVYRRWANALPQKPERRTLEMGWQMLNIWHARFFIRLRHLRGRALTQKAGYFHFLDAALRSKRRYRLSPYAGKITLFRFEEQPSPILYQQDPLLGWSGIAQGGIEIVDLPGGHTDASPEHYQAMCERMRDCIRSAQASIAK
jgi:amino acid adenylation domain-containing protein